MKYEYKVLPVEDGPLAEEALNKLGAEGWRLVSLVFDNGFGGHERTFTHVFIREKR